MKKLLIAALALASGVIYYKKQRKGKNAPTSPDNGTWRQDPPKVQAGSYQNMGKLAH